MNRMLFISMAFACTVMVQAETVEIKVYNPGDFKRVNEIVEVDESLVKSRLGVSVVFQSK